MKRTSKKLKNYKIPILSQQLLKEILNSITEGIENTYF